MVPTNLLISRKLVVCTGNRLSCYPGSLSSVAYLLSNHLKFRTATFDSKAYGDFPDSVRSHNSRNHQQWSSLFVGKTGRKERFLNHQSFSLFHTSSSRFDLSSNNKNTGSIFEDHATQETCKKSTENKPHHASSPLMRKPFIPRHHSNSDNISSLSYSSSSSSKRNKKEDSFNPDPDEIVLGSSEKRITYIGLLMVVATLVSNLIYFKYYHEPIVYRLVEDKFGKFKLKEKIDLSPTTSLFRFEAYIPEALTGSVPIPYHIIIKDDSCQIAREYSPISYSKDGFDLVVKRYEQGSISKLIHGLEIGEFIMARGPFWSFPYSDNMANRIGMIAGGTGITPLYQLIKKILHNPEDQTKISLIYANKNEHEIVLKQELLHLAKTFSHRFSVTFTVDQPLNRKDWGGEVGFVDEKMVKKYLPSAEDRQALVLVCGPDGMVKSLAGDKEINGKQGRLNGILARLGFTERNVFKF